MLPSSGRAAKAQAFAALRHALIQGVEPARHPAQSSSSSSLSLSARRRPVCESTAILLVSIFMEPVTSIYLPLREMTTFDHPSVCNFSNLLWGPWAAPRNESGCLGLLRVRNHQPNASSEKSTADRTCHGPSTDRAKRPPFKTALNVDLHRSQIGEVALYVGKGAL